MKGQEFNIAIPPAIVPFIKSRTIVFLFIIIDKPIDIMVDAAIELYTQYGAVDRIVGVVIYQFYG